MTLPAVGSHRTGWALALRSCYRTLLPAAPCRFDTSGPTWNSRRCDLWVSQCSETISLPAVAVDEQCTEYYRTVDGIYSLMLLSIL